MKEDVLEQITADYLNSQGYFIMTNIKYKPDRGDPDWISKQDTVNSDIDVVGLAPNIKVGCKVITVSCKSWQGGFSIHKELDAITNNKIVSGRERWRAYRELTSPKWGRAYCKRIYELTGENHFEHWIVCTKLNDPENESKWINNNNFHQNLTQHMKVITLKEIFTNTIQSISTTPANSELGRLIQLLKTAFPNISNKLHDD